MRTETAGHRHAGSPRLQAGEDVNARGFTDVTVLDRGPSTGLGDSVTVDYRGTRYTAVVHAEPVVDPAMARIKR
jgi:hypothetical protein